MTPPRAQTAIKLTPFRLRIRPVTLMRVVAWMAIAPAVTGCSLLLIRRDEAREMAAYKEISPGTSRSDVVGALGQPASSQTIDGELTDTFLVPAHMPNDSKENQDGIVMSDTLLLFLPELALVPAELVGEGNKCEYRLSYGKDDRVRTILCYKRLHPGTNRECSTDCGAPPDGSL
jgi:hypothetical protein